MADPFAQLSYSLSPSQTRNFLEDALPAAKEGLNLQQVVCTTTEEVDLPRFRQAWKTMANRHVALGVAFRRDGRQQPYQRFQPPVDVPLSFEERREAAAADKDIFLQNWLEQDRRTLFDLTQAPLLRVAFFRFPDQTAAWIWTFHQILLDGPSALLVLEDFFACYESLAAGHPVALPERRPFSAFIAWQEAWTAAHEKSDRAFWQQLIVNHDIDSMLGLRHPPAAAEVHPRAKQVLELDGATADGLAQLAATSGVKLKTIVLGAWALLLSRYYRSTSVTFGTIRSCRSGAIEGTAGMIGPLTNYLPVHVDLSGRLTALELLRQIENQQRAVGDHRWSSPEVIRGSLPGAAHQQLFDSCVVYQLEDPAREMTRRLGKNGRREFSIREKSNLPLLLSASEQPQLRFELIYQADLFAQDAIDHLLRSFAALLRHLHAAPHQPAGELEPLSSEEKAKVLHALTGPELSVPADRGLHEWFEDQARRTPEAVAIVAECDLTYAELDRRATGLARRLVKQGLGPDQLVAVFLPRSSALLIAILGTLKSGAAYLPVDVELPPARLKGLLEEAGVRAVITEAALASFLPAGAGPVILVEAGADEATEASAAALPRGSGSRLAYAISTSGTTGRPKLIGVEHRQISNLLAFATQRLLQSEDVRCVPFIDSPGFDSSISQIFTTLALGGTLVRLPDLSAVGRSPFFEKFTCLGTTPSLLATILKSTGLPPSVRLIGLGAEAIPPDLLEKLDRLPQVRKVINYYGPTETTVYGTFSIMLNRSDPNHRPDLRQGGRVIGRPIANTRAYVVDDFGRLAPPGAPGELYLAGAAVARGYLNDPGPAAANFLPDSFQPHTGARMYRTGDIVCLLPDGQLEFHGRKDHQLKYNGVRVEAAEIEHALHDFPGIHQAVVDLRSQPGGGQRLVAYLAAQTKDLSRQDLKKALRLRLPDSMIPHHFVFLESLPLRSNGKVDRAALSRLELESPAAPAAAVPLTVQEKQMIALWERNLSRSPIGLNHDYFELGGDSLSAVNLLAAIERQFGLEFKPSVLFEHSTVAELLAFMRHPDSAPQVSDFVPVCSLLALQESGAGVPLVLLPGGTGTSIVHYRNFAQKFAPDHPVYALQYPYAELLEKSDDPLGHLAHSVAEKILAVVGDRPFVLLGHCLGGLLAWHVAGLLKKRKAPPFQLVLYAPLAPREEASLAASLRQAASQSRLHLLINAYRPAWEEWRMDHGSAWWTYLTFTHWMLTNFLVRRGWLRSSEDRFRFVKLSYLRLLESSPLETYADEALLVYHQDEAEVAAHPVWSSQGRRLQLECVPGHHRVWQTSILAILPLLHERLKSVAEQGSVIA